MSEEYAGIGNDEKIDNERSADYLAELYKQACAHAIHYSKILATLRIATIAAVAAAFARILSSDNSLEVIAVLFVIVVLIVLVSKFEQVYGKHWDLSLDEGRRIESTMGTFFNPHKKSGEIEKAILLGICGRLNSNVHHKERNENRRKLTSPLFWSAIGAAGLSIIKIIYLSSAS